MCEKYKVLIERDINKNALESVQLLGWTGRSAAPLSSLPCPGNILVERLCAEPGGTPPRFTAVPLVAAII